MKHLIYLFLVIPQVVSGQYSYDFETGGLDGWLQFPESRWEISVLDSSGHTLHHAYDNPEAGADIIATKLMYADPADTLKLSFRIRHGYNPSSGNNWQCILLADSLHEDWPGSGSSGFIMGVNFKGSDDLLCLWQIDRGELVEIIKTDFNYQAKVGTYDFESFFLQRIPNGTWELYLNAENKVLLGVGAQHVEQNGKCLGFRYSYSSAQDRKLWIDDLFLEGDFYEDTISPFVKQHKTIGLNQIYLCFSETVKLAEISSFLWREVRPDSLSIKGRELHLFFGEAFPNRKKQKLFVSGLVDMEGNILRDTLIDFIADIPEYGDVVINEVMADPEPAVYLPEIEYLELFNNYSDTICLDSWQILVNDKISQIDSCSLPPSAFLLLCEEGQGEAFKVERIIEAWSSSSYLPNSGAEIVLTDNFGSLIHRLKYKEGGYYDQDKEEGGWSLEQYDPGYLCGGEKNWSMSKAWQGGTPGRQNSVHGKIFDSVEPVIKYMGATSEKINLEFSETIMIQDASDVVFKLNNRQISPAFNFKPVVSENICIPSVIESLQKYTLEISGIEDCTSNRMEEISISFQLPEKPLPGYMLISEVMFDPVAGGNEYFELYNNSNRMLDLYDLQFRVSRPGTMAGKNYDLSQKHHFIEAGSYVVFCKMEDKLRKEWELDFEVDVIDVEDWKALPNDEACIYLGDRSGKLIDQFCYVEEMHHDMLADATGISLERIHFSNTGNEEQLWTSAASSVNYGTPGKENSQFKKETNVSDEISVSPRVFSPDMDGWEDILGIKIPSVFAGGTIDVLITDLKGNSVIMLINNGILGARELFFWDGRDMDGNIVFPGIYIFHISIIHDFKTYSVRRTCAVKY